jgi:formamidopyrimidine-DNA glycosylase
MPELPEVETTLRGIRPHLSGQIIEGLDVRDGRLRWPIPSGLPERLIGQSIHGLARRGKYILISTGRGTLILHLGMSGSLRMTEAAIPPRKHDHYDLILTCGKCLRFHDPRRFGCLLWTEDDPAKHVLIAPMGPEPLGDDFTPEHLHARSRGRTAAVKSLMMDSHVVVGVGNIYASESLFRAGIAPHRGAGKISLERYGRLVDAIREVLSASIEQGGTTLRDFVNESGNPGYFKQTLNVYDRAGEPCRVCGTSIKSARLGQRSTFWCPRCQR